MMEKIIEKTNKRIILSLKKIVYLAKFYQVENLI